MKRGNEEREVEIGDLTSVQNPEGYRLSSIRSNK